MIDLVEKSESDGPAKPHPIRADQLKVIPPGPLIDDAVAEVDFVVEGEPKLRQRARDFPSEALRPREFDVTEVDDHPLVAGFGEHRRNRIFEAFIDDLPRIPRPRLLRIAVHDLVLRVRLGLHQRELRGELPFGRNAGTNQPRHAGF
jgi:hypothetical protein